MINIYTFVLWLYVIFIFIVAIVCHEIGHTIYIRHVLKQYPVYSFKAWRFGVKYKCNDPKHIAGVAIFGYIFGTIPIYFFTGAGGYFPIFMILYTVGSARDLEKCIVNFVKWQTQK